jgi:hypothetical protein
MSLHLTIPADKMRAVAKVMAAQGYVPQSGGNTHRPAISAVCNELFPLPSGQDWKHPKRVEFVDGVLTGTTVWNEAYRLADSPVVAPTTPVKPAKPSKTPQKVATGTLSYPEWVAKYGKGIAPKSRPFAFGRYRKSCKAAGNAVSIATTATKTDSIALTPELLHALEVVGKYLDSVRS